MLWDADFWQAKLVCFLCSTPANSDADWGAFSRFYSPIKQFNLKITGSFTYSSVKKIILFMPHPHSKLIF